MDRANSNLQPVRIDLDDKFNSCISHKPSVISYATRVFQESTVGIISSIFTTHSKYRRFFKVFISSLCIAGFIYHCVAFLNHVLGHPEIVNISVNRSETYNFPAYTYCNNNHVRRSEFCRLYPQHCIEPSETFCEKFSSYCGANASLIPKEAYYHELPNEIQTDWVLKYGGVPNVLNISRSTIKTRKGEKKDDEISGPHLRTSGGLYVKACYNIHSVVESDQQPLQKIRRDGAFESSDDYLIFYVNETEMMNPKSEPGVYFFVHSPFEAANPLKKGIYLRGGRTYELYVKMQEEVLLKAPFESNCMDYDELWEKNNRTGPRTKKMCQEKCKLDSSTLRHKCVSPYNLYPHTEWICGDKNLSIRTPPRPQTKVNNNFLFKCRQNCRDECRSSKYTTEFTVKYYIRGVKFDELHRYIRVKIRLSDDEVKVLRHSPKYETVDVISSIGGFMGCWLGIALMDILDFFGSIITVCRYAFRKRLNKEN